MQHEALPTGIVTPLVALVTADGQPDLPAIRALVDHQVRAGIAAVLVNGSMGELGNLSADQRAAMVRAVVSAADGRIPVWAGAGGLGTHDTVAAAAAAAEQGADAILALPPLFFDFSDSELTRHFSSVAAVSELPVLAYDVPARTPRKLPPELIAQMGRDGIIQGVKDSSADLTAARQVCLQTSDIPGFAAYAGTEFAIDAAVTLGFRGSVPGLANILPAVAVAIETAARAGDFTVAEKSQRIYADLFDLVNIPLQGAGGLSVVAGAFKAATMRVLGLPETHVLVPLTAPDEAFRSAVAAVLDPLLTR